MTGSNSECELLSTGTEVNRCAIQRTRDVDRVLGATAVDRSVTQGADQEGVSTSTCTNAAAADHISGIDGVTASTQIGT